MSIIPICFILLVIAFSLFVLYEKINFVRNEYVKKFEEKKEKLKTELSPKEETVIRMSGKLRSCKMDTSKVQEVCEELGIKNPLDPSLEKISLVESITALERSFIGLLDKISELDIRIGKLEEQQDHLDKETDCLQEIISELSDPDFKENQLKEFAELSRKLIQLENAMKSSIK